MADSKEITGFVTVSTNEYGKLLKVNVDGGGEATVFIGNQYQGEEPEEDFYGTVQFTSWKGPGKKWPSKYLEGWDIKTAPTPAPSSNGSSGARRDYVDHHASIAAEWAVGRAVELCCAEAQFARERDYNIEAIARELLGMALDLEQFVGVGKDGWAKVEAKSAEPEPA